MNVMKPTAPTLKDLVVRYGLAKGTYFYVTSFIPHTRAWRGKKRSMSGWDPLTPEEKEALDDAVRMVTNL
jgi:hypothetical protein